MQPLLPGRARDTAVAVRRLRRLALRTREQLKVGLTPWHEEQALAIAAQHLAASGALRAAGRQYETLTRTLEASLAYYLRSCISNLDAAAEAYAESGMPRKTRQLVARSEALRKALSALRSSSARKRRGGSRAV
jgi:post-segregation antitoxin (ccd killing protein)